MMGRKTERLTKLIALLLATAATAAQASTAGSATVAAAGGAAFEPTQAERLADAVAQAQEQRAKQQFGGLEFGVGISFTLDIGTSDRVSEAEIVNGIVRVSDEDNGRARIMLESHYFFKPTRPPFGMTSGDFGWGPFIALQPGTDDIIEAVAAGGMIGFRRPGPGTESFNIGVGIVVDPNTRILGEGIVANEPLPVGETNIRYKEEMQTGILVLASFGF